jgi:hypothetical protein
MVESDDTIDNRRGGEPGSVLPDARVREDDLEPHEGLRYIARLFKALALLLVFMLIAEVVIGLQQDGTAALGTLLVEATRLIVFAGFLWAAGDMAVLLIESNHDLRASRILLGRLNARMERFMGELAGVEQPPPPPGLPDMPAAPRPVHTPAPPEAAGPGPKEPRRRTPRSRG